jgi:hypothetical protein
LIRHHYRLSYNRRKNKTIFVNEATVFLTRHRKPLPYDGIAVRMFISFADISTIANVLTLLDMRERKNLRLRRGEVRNRLNS